MIVTKSFLENCLRYFIVTSGLFTACQAAQVSQLSSQATITYTGSDGTIEYDWIAPSTGSSNSLGTVQVKTLLNGAAPNTITLSPTVAPVDSLTFRGSQWINGTGGPVWSLTYSTDNASVQIYLRFGLAGKLLTVDCSATQPMIAAVGLGGWPFESNIKSIPVPYYPGTPPVYLQNRNLFGTLAFDWRVSGASSMDAGGQQVFYNTLTNGTRNSFSERMIIGISENIRDLFWTAPTEPSPFIQKLSGRTILDVWNNSTFDEVTTSLKKLSSYGVQNCAIILHNWQNQGYDNALPSQFPANPGLGGDSALINLANSAEKAGCLFGLHENYTDYYPNYTGFTPDAVGLTSSSALQNAWFNPSTQIQAYGTKPTWFLTNASAQSPQIRSAYQTNMTFLDVNSSVEPWWRADMDAAAPGAGRFSTFMNATKDLWKYERSIYQGPVFGEGNHHSFWTGQLDGVEAQFGSGGVPTNIGAQAPLLVDLDLQTIHPYQANHGMGYYDRWIAPGEDIHSSGTLDAYRMQQIAFGHQPFVGGDLWSNAARVLVEQNLVGPVAQRYGGQSVSSVQYQFKGNWTDLSTATKSGTWNRVKVNYSNGDTIVANGMAQPLQFQGYTLPTSGWLATGTDLLAYTAVKNGVIVDYSETRNTLFANARNQSDLESSGVLAQPTATGFSSPPQDNTLTVKWRALDFGPVNQYVSFVHFVTTGSAENIAFQCDHNPSFNNDTWTPGSERTDSFYCAVPPSIAPGTYSMRVGLYEPGASQRVPLAGMDDGTRRIIVGTVTVSNSGQLISLVPVSPIQATPDPRMNSTGAIVDFTTIRTDGMVSMVHDDSGWTIRTYPLSRDVFVQIQATKVAKPPMVVCSPGSMPAQVVDAANGYWTLHTNGANSCHW